ncbi:MAG: hypothetical protein HJJLKODD_00257 [Phycisphaerae bacterium]|nr:hypothetical protein [Phycisphaerae bacterium]
MVWETIKRFIQEEDGPTALEYGVCLVLIIIVCVSAVTTLGSKTKSLFPDLAGYL